MFQSVCEVLSGTKGLVHILSGALSHFLGLMHGCGLALAAMQPANSAEPVRRSCALIGGTCFQLQPIRVQDAG